MCLTHRPLPDDHTACARVGSCLLTSTCAAASPLLPRFRFFPPHPLCPHPHPMLHHTSIVRVPVRRISSQSFFALGSGRCSGATDCCPCRCRPLLLSAGPPAGGHDITTFVSATGPGAQPQILKNATQKKVARGPGWLECRTVVRGSGEVVQVRRGAGTNSHLGRAAAQEGERVGIFMPSSSQGSFPALLPALQQDVQLQNAGAWANLTAAPAAAPGAAAPAAPAAAAGGAAEGGAGEDDHLWSEFQGREQQQLQVGGMVCRQRGRVRGLTSCQQCWQTSRSMYSTTGRWGLAPHMCPGCRMPAHTHGLCLLLRLLRLRRPSARLRRRSGAARRQRWRPCAAKLPRCAGRAAVLCAGLPRWLQLLLGLLELAGAAFCRMQQRQCCLASLPLAGMLFCSTPLPSSPPHRPRRGGSARQRRRRRRLAGRWRSSGSASSSSCRCVEGAAAGASRRQCGFCKGRLVRWLAVVQPAQRA